MARRTGLRMQAMAQWRAAWKRALAKLGAAGVKEERRLIGTPYPPPSLPGNPPHRRTGQTRGAIAHWAATSDAGGYRERIGVRPGHPRGPILAFLERGTERMAARPSLRVMLKNLVTKIVPAMRAEAKRR